MTPLARPSDAAVAAAEQIRGATGRGDVGVALVLRSGWSGVVDLLADDGDRTDVAMADLTGFAAPSAAGHRGTVTVCGIGGTPVVVLAGRTHLYEGRGPGPVVHGVHVAAALGCRSVVLTNAAGGLREGMTVGDLVLLSDHLNLTGVSPLSGALFVDLVDAYSPALRSAASDAVARAVGSVPAEGVYAAMPGPQYETPAEIRMLRTLGADLVGMSTVPETIAARSLGLDVVGMSLVTNLAAGITGQSLDHTEVLAAGADGAPRLAAALREALPAIDARSSVSCDDRSDHPGDPGDR